jgi:hypothetical protein
MKILLEVLRLEKAKHADSDFNEQFSFYLLIHVQESWKPTFQHCHNEGKYSDKYRIKPSSQIISSMKVIRHNP